MPVFIKSSIDGFRRCGVAHTREGKEFPDGFFTKEQIRSMDDDPDIMIIAGVPDDDDQGLVDQELIDAANKAIEDGNTTGSGKPLVEAMEDVLNVNVTADMRDRAWRFIQEENKA